MVATLVDPDISREKLRREVELWRANAPHRDRGCILLNHDDEGLIVEVAFLSTISLSVGSGPLPVIVCAVRLNYDNYDLLAPSLTFIDAISRQPARPHVRAFQPSESGPRDVLIDAHPDTMMPFLCIPGVREYHSHPQHTGDSWLLHRALGEGSLTTLCDRIWRYMARSIVGLTVHLQAIPGWPLQAQLNLTLAQGEVQGMPQPRVADLDADQPVLESEERKAS